MRWSVLSLLLPLLTLVAAYSSAGNRLLVVLEDAAKKDSYSKFWADLTARGFELDFQSPKSDALSLFHLGERAYDHVLLLPPSSKAYGNALSPQLLLEFINAEGNILLGLSSESPTPSAIVSLLLEFGIHIPSDRSSVVVDHFNYESSSASEKHDIIQLPSPSALRSDLKNYFEVASPIIVPHAVGQVLGNDSPLLAPILRAPSTAYVYNPKDDAESVDELFASGQQISLVSAIQARNSARFTVLGASEMLEDKWTKAYEGNRKFAEKVSAWTFKEIGVLRVGKLQHHLANGKANSILNESAYPVPIDAINPTIYRVKNEVTYTIELSEYTSTHLSPYIPADPLDIQLEVTMLSPFQRVTLTPLLSTQNSTFYTATVTLPDQHGIFNFRVNYKRPFLTNIDEKRQITVRHFAHDEWPRSWAISGAWTWIAGIWVTVAGWIVFVALWLWSAPERGVGGGKKLQ